MFSISTSVFRQADLPIPHPQVWNPAKVIQVGLLLVILATFLLLPPLGRLNHAAWQSLCILCCAAWVWGTGLMPAGMTGAITLTTLLILRISTPEKVLVAFANAPLLFLSASFMIGEAIQSVGLSQVIMRWLINRLDGSSRRLTALLFGVPLLSSFVIQEHIVVAILFPIVMDIAGRIRKEYPESGYPGLLLISVAWGAVIGGTATYLGGGRALLAQHLLMMYSHRYISFWEWAGTGIPFALALGGLTLTTLLLLYRKEIPHKLPLDSLHISNVKLPGQRRVLFIFIGTVILWCTLSDVLKPEIIAWVGVLLLMLSRGVPSRVLWKGIPWQLILIYGASIALCSALTDTRILDSLAHLSASQVGPMPPVVMLSLLSASSFLHTEFFMSNAATVSALLPVALSFSGKLLSPAAITYAITLPAGLSMFLPMSTPAIALILSSGYLKVRDLALPGIILKLLAWGLLVGYLLLLSPQ